MAEQVNIPEDQLQPGDLVELKYEITSANETIVGMAIHDIKSALAQDPRFDYQGSREVTASNLATGQPVRWLFITVSVRRTLREGRPEIQQANWLVPIVVLVGLVAAAIVAYSGSVVYKTYAIKRIAMADIPEGSKTTALKALGRGSLGLAAGSSLVMAGVVIAVLWVLSRGRAQREYY